MEYVATCLQIMNQLKSVPNYLVCSLYSVEVMLAAVNNWMIFELITRAHYS